MNRCSILSTFCLKMILGLASSSEGNLFEVI
uniref:Uncharacterized protein n=1 Tax=Anguilla anguilla TaxID=7936 RepID=A0A0E9QXM8_ANGAN